MSGALDMLKSERGIMNLLFLLVLAALLFTKGAGAEVEVWAKYGGGVTALYTLAKSVSPGPRAKAAGDAPKEPDEA